MRGARFRTDIRRAPAERAGLDIDGAAIEPLDNGFDVVRLRVRTNPGETEGDLDAVASTGEPPAVSSEIVAPSAPVTSSLKPTIGCVSSETPVEAFAGDVSDAVGGTRSGAIQATASSTSIRP